MIRALIVSAGLTSLDMNKASDRNRTCYDSDTNSCLMNGPANTGGEILWYSPGFQVLPLMNVMIDIKSLVPIWIRETGKLSSLFRATECIPGYLTVLI